MTRSRRVLLLRLLAAVAVLVALVAAFNAQPTQASFRAELWGLGGLHYAEFEQKVRARVNPGDNSAFVLTGQGIRLAPPRANTDGGAHPSPVTVALAAAEAGSAVYYTLDGSIPVPTQQRYREPIRIERTSVLRFRSYKAGYLPSDVVTRTYLIGDTTQLPIVSLTVDPINLWNKYSGIYENAYKTGPKWERDGNVEVFSSGRLQLTMPGRVRVHGGASRGKPKKSFRFRYRTMDVAGADGASNIWTWPAAEEERTVVIRAGGSNVLYRLRDELFASIYREQGGLTSAFEPAFVLLNGEPWGIYDLREYVDNEYLQRHVGHGQYDLIGDQGIRGDVEVGDRAGWDETMAFFAASDLRDEAQYRKAQALVDVDNLIDYWIFNIYAANMDWPHHNTFTFRQRDGDDRRWRWISWDADATFDLEGQGLMHNTLAWATRDRLRDDLRYNNHKGLRDAEHNLVSTLIVRKLLANDEFRARFRARFAQMLSGPLQPAHVEARLDALVQRVAPDLEKDWTRWSIERDAYARNLQQIREFIRKRPEILATYIARELDTQD